MKKHITVAIGSRANYSSIKSFLTAAVLHPSLDLSIICFASAVIDKYGNVAELIEDDGFKVDYKLDTLLLSDTPSAMAKSKGISMVELTSCLDKLKPDVVLTVGDRYETMATAVAASYSNILLAHTMGGEVSGSIDESIRHAITKLSHYHFTACESATKRVRQMGESLKNIYQVGCPRIDLVAELAGQAISNEEVSWINRIGVGSTLDFDQNFVIISIHPVTTESEDVDIESIISVCQKYQQQCLVLWPNADSGGMLISKQIRCLRERSDLEGVRFIKNLPVKIYIKLMNACRCLIGNSSSGIREGAYLGTPVINLGTRQANRDRGENVIDIENYTEEILEISLLRHLDQGKYQSSDLYGSGSSGEKIANIIAYEKPDIQKEFYML